MAASSDRLAERRRRLAEARFYGIFDLGYAAADDAEATCRAMLAGGVDIIQLRAKGWAEADILALAKRLRPVVFEGGGLFIVNDSPAIARAAEADGVHIGQDDMRVAEARERLAADQLVGKSTHSVAQAVATEAEAPDYIALGPLYPTPTKPDYVPVGLGMIAQVHAAVTMRPFCIGGMNLETLPDVLAAGAERVVLVSAILQAEDVTDYCRRVRQALDETTSDVIKPG